MCASIRGGPPPTNRKAGFMSDPMPPAQPPGAPLPELQRFEPLPDQRLRWKPASRSDRAAPPIRPTPERWFEPTPRRRRTRHRTAVRPASRSYGRGLIAVVLATSLVGAVLGAGGTYAALRASGALDAARPRRRSDRPGQNVSIESEHVDRHRGRQQGEPGGRPDRDQRRRRQHRRRLGDHLRRARLDPDQQARRGRRQDDHRPAPATTAGSPARSTAWTR